MFLARFRRTDRFKLLSIVAALLTLGFLTTNIVSFAVSRSVLKRTMLRNELPLTGANIYSEIQGDLVRPIFVSSLMSHDTFVRDWLLAGERDPVRITRYLDEIREKYGVFTAFLISERSHTYYHFSGPARVVSETDAADAWYVRARAMTAPYEINIDPNEEQSDAPTIFVNYKIFDYDGKFLGVTGVGLKLENVSEIVSRYTANYKRDVYFVDGAGKVTVRARTPRSPIDNIKTTPGLSNIADGILTGAEGYFEYERDGHTMLLTTRLIPELGWRVIVEIPESEVVKDLWGGFVTNIAIGLVIILITIGSVGYSITIFQRRLERAATTDKLTGIANRQAFDAAFDHAIRSRRRTGVAMSLVLIDIDHFKRINDAFGHLAGDEAIRAVVEVIRTRVRDADLICRWGGDEFIVMLEGAPIADAAAVAEEIRRRAEDIVLSAIGGPGGVTISAGVADVRDEDDADDALNRADRALYVAKEAGRDRVALAPD